MHPLKMSETLVPSGTTKAAIYIIPMTPPCLPSFRRATLLKPLATPPAGNVSAGLSDDEDVFRFIVDQI